ncbi:hypothetical protein K439DRAFT_987266 [Ramaria rubella]|nr:hypothetical protein K439DRAFT_987266 [Ramaria rubella]
MAHWIISMSSGCKIPEISSMHCANFIRYHTPLIYKRVFPPERCLSPPSSGNPSLVKVGFLRPPPLPKLENINSAPEHEPEDETPLSSSFPHDDCPPRETPSTLPPSSAYIDRPIPPSHEPTEQQGGDASDAYSEWHPLSAARNEGNGSSDNSSSEDDELNSTSNGEECDD